MQVAEPRWVGIEANLMKLVTFDLFPRIPKGCICRIFINGRPRVFVLPTFLGNTHPIIRAINYSPQLMMPLSAMF